MERTERISLSAYDIAEKNKKERESDLLNLMDWIRTRKQLVGICID